MKVVRLSALRTGRLYLPGNIPGIHWVDPRAGRIMSMKNSNNTIGNRTRDISTWSVVKTNFKWYEIIGIFFKARGTSRKHITSCIRRSVLYYNDSCLITELIRCYLQIQKNVLFEVMSVRLLSSSWSSTDGNTSLKEWFTPKCSLNVQSIPTEDLLGTTSGTARGRVFSN